MLTRDRRAAVDRGLVAAGIEAMGVRGIADLARRLATAADPDAAPRRARAARSGRRVAVRPAADGTADPIAHLPVEQAVACFR